MRGEGFEVKVEAATGRYVYCVMGVAKEGKLQVAARLEFKRLSFSCARNVTLIS